MKLDFVDFLFEGTADNPRIPHPENAIFTSSAEAKRAIETLKEIIASPENITIKWDGEIALFFGRDARGKFFCSDKYMYPKGILAHSVQDWITYDQNKPTKTMRPDLYKKLESVWSSLEQSVGPSPVVYKGDYFTTNQVGNNYVFRGPTAQYTIPANSSMGINLKNKTSMIIVHSKDNQPWDGKGLAGVVTNFKIDLKGKDGTWGVDGSQGLRAPLMVSINLTLSVMTATSASKSTPS